MGFNPPTPQVIGPSRDAGVFGKAQVYVFAVPKEIKHLELSHSFRPLDIAFPIWLT
jgi:hypothetical protein